MTIQIIPYSGFHPKIVDKGYVSKMSNGALRLYLFLMRKSDRYSRRKFPAVDKEIAEAVGVSPRTLGAARAELTAMGIVRCERSPGESFTYTLCDLDTGKPYSDDPQVRPPHVKKEKTTSQGLVTAPGNRSLPPPEAARPDKSQTDFDYGCNVTSEKPAVSPSNYNPFR
jgi:hypothetical protein